MNARCFDRSISDILSSTKHLEYQDSKARIVEKAFDASEWDYKKSPFQTDRKTNPRYITRATFNLTPAGEQAHDRIAADCKKYIAERVDKGHFKYPSAGSVFKNNHAFGAPSGKLIDACGLKGLSIGGAQTDHRRGSDCPFPRKFHHKYRKCHRCRHPRPGSGSPESRKRKIRFFSGAGNHFYLK